MKIAAALFDLDGTLVDSLDDLTDAVNHMLAGFGRQAVDTGQVRQLVGKGARNLVQRALVTESDEEIQRGLTAFTEFNSRHIADKSRLYPGILDMLRQLSGKSLRMAVISNKPEGLSRQILRELAIDHFFEQICGGDSFPEMKPSPLPLLKVIEQFGQAPAGTVMVGDSINDIQAGLRAGIRTIGCTWGYGRDGELADADLLAKDSADLLRTIKELAG